MSQAALYQYVVYDRPADFPDSFVVRRFAIIRGWSEPVADAHPHVVASSLELARAAIPPGMVNIGRNPADDDVIVEVWT